MLQSFRDTIMGPIGYFILALIILVFTLWGVQSYLGGGTSASIADVDGVAITELEYENALNAQQQQIRQIYRDVPAQQFETPEFRQGVLNNLITNKLVTKAAEDRGYNVSDKMLQDRITSEPAFQENGVFSKSKYEQVISAQRRSKKSFEDTLRDQLQLTQVGGSIMNTTFLPAAAKSQYSALEQQQRNIRYLTISAAALQEGITVTPAESQAYYDENSAQFMSDEQVRLNYVQLSEADLRAEIEVDPEALRALYDEAPDSFRATEFRQIRHILLPVVADASAEQEQVVKGAAEEIYARLGAGENFAELAKALSQDDLTAANGGVLPDVYLGDLHRALEAAVFSASEGDFTAPARTDVGFQIAKVDKVIGGGVQSFEEAKADVEVEYRQRQVDERFQEITETLASMSFEDDSNINDIAEATGLKLQQSDWITRQARTGIAADSAVAQAAFSDGVLNLGEKSDVIDMRDGSQIVLSLAERKSSELQSFDTVLPRVESLIKDQKARELAQNAAVDMVSALQAGTSFDQLAVDQGVSLEVAEQLTRRSRDLDAAVVTHVFRMPAATDTGAIHSAVTLNNGDQVVVALDSVISAPAGSPASSTSASLNSSYSARELEAFMKAMRENGNVRILAERFLEAPQ